MSDAIIAGIMDVSKFCTELVELDVSGCWQLTDNMLYALQESLLHMREHQNLHFSLTIGGEWLLYLYWYHSS